MHGKKSFLALSTAFAALFVGCEWTGSSDSDSWSSAYDAMNFSGTYRAVTTATTLQALTSNTNKNTNVEATVDTKQSEEYPGIFQKGYNVASGQADHPNIVAGSFQVIVGDYDYVWNDNGSGKLVFTSPKTGAPQDDTYKPVKVIKENLGTTGNKEAKQWAFNLKNPNIVEGSLVLTIGNIVLNDQGGGVLSAGALGSGTISYDSGAISVTLNSNQAANTAVSASYSYLPESNASSTISGSGTILYASGAWSIQISEMPEKKNITIRYSYTPSAGESTDDPAYKTKAITTTTGTQVSALTVSQNGQNLTITLNNGIVMTGKFTNVQQTGKVNQDTNAGYNTYNAQFQVQTTDNKMVGSLNYDLSTGYRMMNGTWTWGKSSYDVQAVGPAWLNSADASTLSPGVLTK